MRREAHIHGAAVPRATVAKSPTVIEVTLPCGDDEDRERRLGAEGQIALEIRGSTRFVLTAREAISLARGLEAAADKLIDHLPKDGSLR